MLARAGVDPEARSTLERVLSKVPVWFEENRGQDADARARYRARGADGVTTALRADGVTMAFPAPAPAVGASVLLPTGDASARGPELSWRWVGAFGDARPQPGPATRLVLNYYIGNDPSRWVQGLPAHEAVRYGRVWPGIDIEYHARTGRLQYDFHVEPGADPSVIAMRFDGDPGLAIDEAGDLRIELDGGELRHEAPVAFQDIDGRRVPVEAAFELASAAEVRVKVGAYDRARPLVIDPSLVFSTKHVDSQLGGSIQGTGIGVLPDGSTYISGIAAGVSGFVMRTGADGSWDVRSNGQVFFAFISGTNGSTQIQDLDIEPSNTDRHLFLCGSTTATDLPTRSPAQAALGGGIDGFLITLNSSLGLEYGTYIGGSGLDVCLGVGHIGQNPAGAGYTESANFPTNNAIDSTYGGAGDAWVARGGGTTLNFSTYLGGTGTELAAGLAVDSSGNIYVVGETNTAAFPVLPTPATAPLGCGKGGLDTFVTKLPSNGASILASTCIGGTGGETATGVAIDSAGDVYVAGGTTSTDFPVLSAVQATYGGGTTDAFLSKLDPSFASLEFSTYLGGAGVEGVVDPFGVFGTRVEVNHLDNAYVAGRTEIAVLPNDFPTVRALSSPPSPLGAGDLFLSKFTPTGSSMLFSTLFGGTGSERLFGLAIDADGNALLVGSTASEADFPLRQGPHAGLEDCSNGIDDDGNQLVDCDDADCSYPGGPCEICGNGIDDDGNTVADCADIPCVLDGQCSDGSGGADLDLFFVSIGDDICADVGCPDDGNACTQDCNPATGACINVPVVCDDGLFCNGAETCDTLGGCQAGTPPILDDGISCTADSCDEGTDSVVHATQDAACNDGLFCNGVETCSAVSGCVAGSDPCVDGIACTADSCNDVTDSCVFTPSNAACDDSNVCTSDTCTVGVGCEYAPQAGSCDDGLFCNGADNCVAGVCEHAGDPCPALGACQTCDESNDLCEDTDPDVDLICAPEDNCPVEFNPDQRNFDCPDANFFLNGGCADPALVPAGRRGCCDGGDVCDLCPANDDQAICDHGLSGGESIGPAGGSFTLGSCISVSVPAGALPSHTSISVSTGLDPSDNPSVDVAKPFKIKAAGGASVHKVTMLPDGQQFALPITLSFCWDDRDGDDVVDRGVCVDNPNTSCTEAGSFSCDANGDCACGRCQNGGNLSENGILLRRDGTNFDYAGFGGPLPGSVRKCGDLEHQNPAICASTPSHTADCNDAPGTGQATIALCCDKTSNSWLFETCTFSEMYLGELAGALVPGGGPAATDCLVEWSVLNPFNTPEFDKKGFLSGKQSCHDGDATCDGDGLENGECVFRVGACFAVEDRRLADKKTDEPLCPHQADIASFTLSLPRNDDGRPVEQGNFTALRDAVLAIGQGGAAAGGENGEVVNFLPSMDADGGCTDMVEVRVPLKGPDADRAARAKLKAIVLSDEALTGSPIKDVDKLSLTCLPPLF